MPDLRASEIRDAYSFDIPSVIKFCLKLSMVGVASFFFSLKDGVPLSDSPTSLGFGVKVTGFVLTISVTEGTGIVFAVLELLESMLLNLSKRCLTPGLLERKGEIQVLLSGPITSVKHPSLC